LFFFFGIIYANEDKVYTNQQLTELVDQLMANQKKMDGKIVANEADISGNKANILANSVDLQALTSTFNNLVVFNTVMYTSAPPLYPDTIIDFHETETNIGNGMDSSTGIFTAPVSGTYFFSFSGYILPTSPHQGSILLRVVCQNNADKSIFLFGKFSEKFYVSYTWTMSLDQNDEIYLKSPNDSVEGPCQFSGQLGMAQ